MNTDLQNGLALRQHHLQIVRNILDTELSLSGCRVYVFGSRATNSARSGSDLDLAVEFSGDITHRLDRTRTAFEESDLPYTVDIIDLKHSSENFRQEIERYGRLIWEC